MERYLSIVEEDTKLVIDEVKLTEFLAQTKVWEYAKITKQDYKDMSAVDRFALLQDYYSYMDKTTGRGIDLAPANRINQASVITLTKQSAGSNQTFSTTLVAESKNGDVSEIAGEPVWKKSAYFGQLRTDYNLEKANFPENAFSYINQAYLTVQKSKKIFYGKYFLLGQIHESANLPSNIQSYVCKEDKVKDYHPKYDKNTRKFLGLYETVRFLVVRGDPFQVFLSYGYDTEKSKVLYSIYKGKIPSSFSGMIFNHHIKLVEKSND